MGRLPETTPSLSRYLRGQARAAQRQAQASPFARSGSSVPGEGITQVAGELRSADFDGNLNGSDAGTVGWALNAVRAAFGELILRAGSVGNEALSSPTKPEKVWFYAQGFALSTTAATLASDTVTVPAGFTTAVVNVTARIFAQNSTAGPSSMACVAKVAGVGGFNFQCSAVVSTDIAISISPFSTVLTGLTPGSTFDLRVDGNSNGAGWAAWAGNTAEMTGSIVWGR